MREVNNNTANSANLNFTCVHPIKHCDVQPDQEMTAETTDLKNMPADVLGRSQVLKPAIEEDAEVFLNNPKLIMSAERLFDYLVEEQHIPYEQAAKIMQAAVKEFSNA